MTERALGIDVSKWQGIVDWKKAAETASFAYIRVADGLTVDPYFKRNWSGSYEVVKHRGVYQYYRPGIDPYAQAQVVIDACAHETFDTDLPVALDVESIPPGMYVEDVARGAQMWVEEIQRHFLIPPIIYTYALFSLWNASSQWIQWNKKHHLWVADYRDPAGPQHIPEPWEDWTFWQKSCSGKIPGVTGKVDLNVFKGSVEDLDEWVDEQWRKA